ncbi:MAG: helix-turn-helix transcriptional regulator [Chitinophagales bacterium]|nr:helix-turn-helix transcriptional regulator [Chitinophagales bacterium]
MQTIGACIKHCREEQNLTQEYVAAQLGISQQAYSKIESGETAVNALRLFQIATVLKADVNRFYAQAEHLRGNNTVNQHTHNNSYGTTSHDIELYERFIQFLLKENTEKDELIRQLLNGNLPKNARGGGGTSIKRRKRK